MAKKTIYKRKVSRSSAKLNPNAAGIDLGASIHYVAVAPERDEDPVRHFGTYTEELQALAAYN